VLRPLRLAIVRGDLPPGQRLLEQELAAKFGVSREPIRYALHRLEHEGLVESRQRRGVYVVGLSREDVDEIYDLRSLLETHAVRRATERATVSEIDHLQYLVDTMADLARRGRFDLLTDPDLEFHRRIILAAEHRRLLVAWAPSAELTGAMLSITSSVRHNQPRAAANHQPIVDAIRARDPAAASAAMAAHMAHARAVMQAVVSGEIGLDAERAEPAV
jgi:DNA-binding GntR family transcriptional regulator